MSFKTDIQDPINKKILLAEIDLPVSHDIWINYESGIWYINLMPGDATVTGSDGETGYYRGQNDVHYSIKSVLVDDEFYTGVTSIADLRSTDKSFMFDYGAQELFVHFEDWTYPKQYTVYLGNVLGYSDQVDQERGAYYDNVYYDPRILEVPSLSKSKDPLFFGVLEFQGGNITLNNADGGLDDIVEFDIYGQPIRIYLGFEGYDFSDFQQVFAGYVEDVSWNFQKTKIQIRDPRKKLSKNIPINKFNQTDYPDLNDDDVDKPIPIAYGTIRDAPVIIANKEDGSGPYECYFMDTEFYSAQSLDEVYVDGVPTTPNSIHLSDGYFTLTAGQVKDGDSFLTVTCDFHGANVINGLDVIKDINAKYGDTQYVDTVYNLPEWIYETSLARDVGLLIHEEIKIIEVIEKICNALDGIFFMTDLGLFSFRSYRSDRTITKTIHPDEWLEDPEISEPSDEFLSSVIIGYSPKIYAEEYRHHRNNDYESEVYDRYKVYKEETFDTILTNVTDADAKAEAIMARSKQIERIVKRKTGIQNIDLEIMDFVIAEHNRPYGFDTFYDRTWSVWEISRIVENLTKGEITLDLRKIRDYDWTETFYMQGFLIGNRLMGEKLFGPTAYIQT